jgi:homoserine O-acetyltransferase/O-succinyltransferase
MKSCFLAICLTARLCSLSWSEESPKPTEGDFTVRDFRFKSGEVLPQLRLHYVAYGKPERDGAGHVTNAVMIVHSTTSSSEQFTGPRFAGVLFGPGQLLDVNRYFVILPDTIGHGHSSKPSDGLRAKFPHYDYDDMVEAEHVLLTEGLKVDHLRLYMGMSMGCMHAWIWAEKYPDSLDAAMPLGCSVVQIAGRNRMFRKIIMDAVRNDPEYMNGNYQTQPVQRRCRPKIRLGTKRIAC